MGKPTKHSKKTKSKKQPRKAARAVPTPVPAHTAAQKHEAGEQMAALRRARLVDTGLRLLAVLDELNLPDEERQALRQGVVRVVREAAYAEKMQGGERPGPKRKASLEDIWAAVAKVHAMYPWLKLSRVLLLAAPMLPHPYTSAGLRKALKQLPREQVEALFRPKIPAN